MHRTLGVLASILAFAVLSGCPAKPKNGECKNGEDCAAQEGFGKVCVDGHCQECGQDNDCKAGFVCRSLRCVPRPECERNEDCATGKACEAGKCVVAAAPAPKVECSADADCGAGKTCYGGKCVASTPVDCPTGGGKLIPVYFGFNEATLTPESRDALTRNATCVKDRGYAKLVIEGNCDERGTAEYNIHLGQRRAEAAKKFLVGLGVRAKAVKTVSYGKERPVCTEQTEDCWRKNRRDDTLAQ